MVEIKKKNRHLQNLCSLTTSHFFIDFLKLPKKIFFFFNCVQKPLFLFVLHKKKKKKEKKRKPFLHQIIVSFSKSFPIPLDLWVFFLSFIVGFDDDRFSITRH